MIGMMFFSGGSDDDDDGADTDDDGVAAADGAPDTAYVDDADYIAFADADDR